MLQTFDTKLHKARLCYEHGKVRKENMKTNSDKSKSFSDNQKPEFNPSLYRKQNNNFLANKKINKSGTKP